MNRLEFQQNLQSARAEWDALIDEALALGDEAIESRAGEGEWSLKDYVAHNIWYEREILRLLTTRNLSYPPSDELWATRNDERNKVLYDIFRGMPVADVLAEEKQVYKELLVEVRKLTDADLNDPRRFQDMPMDWIPWKVIAENSYEHYTNHLDDIKNLLKSLQHKDHQYTTPNTLSLIPDTRHPTPDPRGNTYGNERHSGPTS